MCLEIRVTIRVEISFDICSLIILDLGIDVNVQRKPKASMLYLRVHYLFSDRGTHTWLSSYEHCAESAYDLDSAAFR